MLQFNTSLNTQRSPERALRQLHKALWDIEPIPFRSFLPGNDRPENTLPIETWMFATAVYLRATRDSDDWPRAKRREAFRVAFRRMIGRPRTPKKPLLSEAERQALQDAHDEIVLEVARFSLRQ